MTDDAVREIHGVACRDNNIGRSDARVTVRESEDLIVLNASSGSYGSVLTQWQARYLAAKLYRLSRRIRQRTE